MASRKHKTKLEKPYQFMSYQDRLRGYERDKKELLANDAPLPADEFSGRLKALQDKWRI